MSMSTEVAVSGEENIVIEVEEGDDIVNLDARRLTIFEVMDLIAALSEAVKEALENQ